MTHQGAACDAASVHFGSTIRRTHTRLFVRFFFGLYCAAKKLFELLTDVNFLITVIKMVSFITLSVLMDLMQVVSCWLSIVLDVNMCVTWLMIMQ